MKAWACWPFSLFTAVTFGQGYYSDLKQINVRNVSKLERAWSYDTGDAFKGSEMQCQPLVVGDTLYATTPKLRVIALAADTGKLRWSFDPKARPGTYRSRGLMHWNGRIYIAAEQWFWALDAKTGNPVEEFGEHGRVNLRDGLGRDGRFNISMTSPGVVYKDLLIVGSITGEDLPAAPGDIRAYDARTGKLRWSFHTIPHPGEFGYDTWPPDAWQRSGGANSWPGMTLDERRGIVFVPTGSAAFDFYGADRHGDNLFANCLLALDASTGKRIWHFQFVRHDVWDRDLPASPVLVTLNRGGRRVEAVAQATKSGQVFVFERETGKPVFPIEYRHVEQSSVDGEKTSAEQPFSLLPLFARQTFTEADVTQRTPAAHKAVLDRLRKVRSGPPFTPPSLEGTVIIPGFDGGAEWGGAPFDPETGLLFVNSNEMPWILQLVERRPANDAKELYKSRCASCHREDLAGTPPEFPSLVGLAGRRSQQDVVKLIREGAGRMPPFPNLSEEAVNALVAYVMRNEVRAIAPQAPAALKYTHNGYNKFLDPDGYPAIRPPWGTLNAVDLNKGSIRWKIPFGEHPELADKNTGSENYGGGIATAGGLLFIGATNFDKKFRAFDKRTGKLLWSTTLPAAGNATPVVYAINGKQYVVIGAGGGKSKQPSGGTYEAFALSHE